ncbi:hypothetical protein [Candidatus Soleaferrea massiliensis]|uniref:hypothetical protein n=1 Tax=Candidatus Soleaferrea massiliensis TaxID=1470354 RepID=UPI00058B7580|nr:hypothetical protein [Candidatus Soleaferrea massiliensis]
MISDNPAPFKKPLLIPCRCVCSCPYYIGFAYDLVSYSCIQYGGKCHISEPIKTTVYFCCPRQPGG